MNQETEPKPSPRQTVLKLSKHYLLFLIGLIAESQDEAVSETHSDDDRIPFEALNLIEEMEESEKIEVLAECCKLLNEIYHPMTND
ncbi:hypothetical protein [Cylindrospermum sp. FACHB-282]|uniref:hypothetical protein n=1 Tax=Cylindrospermum sp. FACHB-282 TaxID=2692794 RepID=UPI00168268AC|nr:hypothetical protein [Cylindrospermum sp. FACHB-282]MBD2388811.1 hypothetical protein [Cylindrospermum sp. FACHB-282]